MMSYSFKVLFYVLIFVIMTVPSDADDDECTTELKVRRHTAYEAYIGQELRIECPVVFCDNSPPTVCWYKVKEEDICLNDINNNHIKTEWEISNPSEGTSYLLFQSIISSDSGGYRCKSGGSMSHIINIHVYGLNINDTRKPITNDANNQSETEPADRFLMYMYSAAGIGSFVIIVIIISVICMRRCKGKSRTDGKEIQYSPRRSPTRQAEELSSVVYMVAPDGKTTKTDRGDTAVHLVK